MEINLLTVESPGRKPDWLGLSRSHEKRCEYEESYISFSSTVAKSGEEKRGGSYSLYLLRFFLWTGTTFAHLQVLGNAPLSQAVCKYNLKRSNQRNIASYYHSYRNLIPAISDSYLAMGSKTPQLSFSTILMRRQIYVFLWRRFRSKSFFLSLTLAPP